MGNRPNQSAVGVRSTRGNVKFWKDDKGYGFIDRDSAGVDRDIFFHLSAMDGETTIASGTVVDVDYFEGKRGLEAESVRIVDR